MTTLLIAGPLVVLAVSGWLMWTYLENKWPWKK